MDPLSGLLHLVSALMFAILLLTIFGIETGLLTAEFAIPVIGTLGITVALRYGTIYHRFTRSIFKTVTVVPLFVGLGVLGSWTCWRLSSAIATADVVAVLDSSTPGVHSHSFLPEWWIGAILLIAGVLALVGLLASRDTEPYPKPGDLREIARSPIYFGGACTIFGIWAVLLVGFRLQRVIFIAPLFEELLKFGVAILVGASLFGRSTLARVAVAAVVGLVFGVIEHYTTYPSEADAVFLYRSVFHMATTMLSISAYTVFESENRLRLQTIAPTLSILVHFFYNTFAVVSGVITAVAFGSPSTTVTLVYGGFGILVLSVLLALSLLRTRILVALYAPFEHVLSDLV